MALAPAVAPTVDTSGRFGVEARFDLTLAFGDTETAIAYVGGGPGGGYSELLGGYFLHSAEVGAQIGSFEQTPAVRGRVGLLAAPRVTADGIYMGVGGVGDVLFGVVRTGSVRPYRGLILLGARIQGECLCVRPEAEDGTTLPVAGLFSHAFVMQWIFIHEPLYPVAQDPP
jgi:hypothetical protein